MKNKLKTLDAKDVVLKSTIQKVIDAHRRNKCGCDKLDYADDLIVMTLERILNDD